MLPLAVLVLYIGLAPGLTLRAMDPTLNRVLARMPLKGSVPVVAAAQTNMSNVAANTLANTQKSIFAGLFSLSR